MKKQVEEQAALDQPVKYSDVIEKLAFVMGVPHVDFINFQQDASQASAGLIELQMRIFISRHDFMNTEFADAVTSKNLTRSLDGLGLYVRKINKKLCPNKDGYDVSMECVVTDIHEFYTRLETTYRKKATDEFHKEVDRVISE